eukprot:TRINITY_DN9160_c0_g1_i14.p1 TRINITY_DN9160_c0_g1~~TRINITY_DN9160_c0_g1_i14.p1  ORF type:complete len:420 (-),score=32.96 TRINITY_DN9160_c0_g1_i14:418-1629(-)
MNVPYTCNSFVIQYRTLLKQISIHYGVLDDQQTTQPRSGFLNIRRALRRFTFKKKQKQQPKINTQNDKHTESAAAIAQKFTPNPIVASITLTILASTSKFITDVLTRANVQGKKKFEEMALLRPKGTPLITVSNHVSAVDDPAVLTAVIPVWTVFRQDVLRWSMCAKDRCFKYAMLNPLFKWAKTLPIERGKGLDQPGVIAAQEYLNQGDWVHMFPEGTRTKDGKIQNLKKGVGKLIRSCTTTPLIVPIIHTGMDKLFPKGSKIPVPFQEIRVIIGDPIDVQDILQTAPNAGWDEDEVSMIISKRIELHMKVIHAQLHENAQEEAQFREQLQYHRQSYSYSQFGDVGWSYSIFAQKQQQINQQQQSQFWGKGLQQKLGLQNWKQVWSDYCKVRQLQLQNIVGV